MTRIPDTETFMNEIVELAVARGHDMSIVASRARHHHFFNLKGRGNILIRPRYEETLKMVRWEWRGRMLAEALEHADASLHESLRFLHACAQDKVVRDRDQEYTCVGFGDLDDEDANRLARYHHWLLTELNCTFDEEASADDSWYEHFRLPSEFGFRMARYKKNPLFLDMPGFSCNYPGDLEAYLGDVRRARDEFVTVTRHLGTPVLYASTHEGGQ